MVIPKCLFRGDSDPENKRKLRETYKGVQLLTNLTCGGNGSEILNTSLSELTNKHISSKWDKTHFLSFTTEEKTAFNYGSTYKGYDEIYDESDTWDFAILTLDTSMLIQETISELHTGIFMAEYWSASTEFAPKFKIILVDAFTHLRSIKSVSIIDLNIAIENAEKDYEWLILPASPFGNNGEFTGKLDTNCIKEIRVYRFQ